MLGRDEMTTKDLATRLGDVAPATLYRHVGALVEGQVLEVVNERRVRGSVERTLRLRLERTSVDTDDPMFDDEALRAGFLSYLASLAAMFDSYLEAPHGAPKDDLVSFRQLAVMATDDEWLTVLTSIRAAVEPFTTRTTTPSGARRRVLATVSVPVD
jgi:AcrR family transcriptional regulator